MYFLIRFSSITLLSGQSAVIIKDKKIIVSFYSPGLHFFYPLGVKRRTISVRPRKNSFKDFPLDNNKVNATITWKVIDTESYAKKFKSEVYASRWIKGMIYHVLKKSSYSNKNMISSDILIKRCDKYLIDSGIKITDLIVSINNS